MSLENFLIRYGSLAVLIGAAFEGDVTMILAGVIAHLGLVDFPLAVAAGALGACCADAVCYWIGRTRRSPIQRSRVYTRVGPFVERLAIRVGTWELAVARFVYGARIASMLFWGMQGLPFARFAAIDLLGCSLWAMALATLGFVFSGSVAVVVGRVKRAELWLLVALVGTVAVVACVRYLMRRRWK